MRIRDPKCSAKMAVEENACAGMHLRRIHHLDNLSRIPLSSSAALATARPAYGANVAKKNGQADECSGFMHAAKGGTAPQKGASTWQAPHYYTLERLQMRHDVAATPELYSHPRVADTFYCINIQ